MKKTYSGSGIIPIIKDSNNNYYFILFKSVIRKKGAESLIEDAGGEYDGSNIKISAIRELKEESSMLINLEELKKSKQIIRLNYVLNKYNLKIKSLNKLIYSAYFVYLELKDGNLNLNNMRESFISNMRNLWKAGFSVYTENKDIIFIPVKNISDSSMNIKDYTGKEYLLFERTFNIFKNLLKYDLANFIKSIEKMPIYLEETKINNFNFNKETINNLVSYQ